MEYISSNSGILAPSMVKTGDKIIIIEDAYSTFSEKTQKVYWNAKVQLPNGDHRLAGLMESCCDEFVKKWGKMTQDWTGRTVEVEIRTSKAGNPYIWMIPCDYAKVDIAGMKKLEEAKHVDNTPPPDERIEYPTEEINPDDIPF